MSVRCKFKVTSITKTMGQKKKLDTDGNFVKGANGYDEYEPCEMATVKMSPVYANNDPKHENSKFWAASPSGSFELNTVNMDAVAQLTLDGEFYIDITPATKL